MNNRASLLGEALFPGLAAQVLATTVTGEPLLTWPVDIDTTGIYEPGHTYVGPGSGGTAYKR